MGLIDWDNESKPNLGLGYKNCLVTRKVCFMFILGIKQVLKQSELETGKF